MLKKLLLTALIVLLAAGTTLAATYKVDPVHSRVEFTVPHLMVFKVKGEFTDYSGEVIAEPGSGTLQSARADIKVASIDTQEPKRDDHLRSPDFFDAASFPDMTFESTKVERNGDQLTVYGKLTIRGTTRDITLTGHYLGEATDPWGNARIGFEASGNLNRKDYGLTWNKALETGGVVVGDEVTIGLEVQAIKQ